MFFFIDLVTDSSCKVIKYDEGPYAVLQSFTELRVYVVQNSSSGVKRKREIRLALRCLEHQRVIWPYDHITVSVMHPRHR